MTEPSSRYFGDICDALAEHGLRGVLEQILWATGWRPGPALGYWSHPTRMIAGRTIEAALQNEREAEERRGR